MIWNGKIFPKKLKKNKFDFFYKLIEKKLNEAENEILAANQDIDKQERELTDDVCDLNTTCSTTTSGFTTTTATSSCSDLMLMRTPSTSLGNNRKFINKLYSEKKNSTSVKCK